MFEIERWAGARTRGCGDGETRRWEDGPHPRPLPHRERGLTQHSALDSQNPEPRTQNQTQHSALSAQDSPRRLPVVVGISGASGAALARQAILRLGQAGYPAIVTCTSAGKRVWQEELDESYDDFVQLPGSVP